MRLVSAEGEQLGIQPIGRALEMAQEAGLDLVEVAPNSDPPVCRIMDYKKFLYERTRKQKEARKHQRQVEIKGVRLRPSIDEGDYKTKLNAARKFLLKGFRVRVNVIFRGRELRRYELGTELLDRLLIDLKDIGFLEPGSRTQRRQITAMICPTKEVEAAAAKALRDRLQAGHAEEHEEEDIEDEDIVDEDEDDDVDEAEK